MGVSKNEYEIPKQTLTTGANADTNFTVTGIAVGDTVTKIWNLTDLAEVSLAGLVISADAIKITASTSGKKLGVFWNDLSAG